MSILRWSRICVFWFFCGIPNTKIWFEETRRHEVIDTSMNILRRPTIDYLQYLLCMRTSRDSLYYFPLFPTELRWSSGSFHPRSVRNACHRTVDADIRVGQKQPSKMSDFVLKNSNVTKTRPLRIWSGHRQDVTAKLVRPLSHNRCRERSSSPLSSLSWVPRHMRSPICFGRAKENIFRHIFHRQRGVPRYRTPDLVPLCARQQDAFPRRPHGDIKHPSRISPRGWLATPPGSTVCLTSNVHLLHQQAHASTSRLEAPASTLSRWALWLSIGTQDNHQNDNLIY